MCMNSEKENKPMALIEHYFAIGRYTNVISLVKQRMAEDMENKELWYMLAVSHYSIGQYEEAFEPFLKAFQLGYDKGVIYYFLGGIYMATEQWQKAEESFLEALHNNPNDAYVYSAYAILMKMTGHRKKGSLLVEKALALDPNSTAVLYHYTLTEMAAKKEKHNTALALYMNSADSEFAKLIHLGWSAAFNNRFKEAKEYYRQAFLIKPEDKRILSNLEELEIKTHPLLLPYRIVERIGGIGFVFIMWLILCLLLDKLISNDNFVNHLLRFSIFFTLYYFISIPIVKGLRKWKSPK